MSQNPKKAVRLWKEGKMKQSSIDDVFDKRKGKVYASTLADSSI